MSGASQINQGSLAAIFDPSLPEAVEQPIVQCVQIKPLAAQPGNPERFRVVFSDIKNFVQTMLATQINYHVQNGTLRKGCFVKLLKYQANELKGKKILIILELEVLTELGEAEKIGDPQSLEKSPEAPSKPAALPSNGFYGDQKPPAAAPAPKPLPSRNQPPSSSAHGNIYPIEAVTPFANKWAIKVRCTNKSPIKTYHNKNGEGKLFNVTLLDESGEIRATGFNDQCDALYDVFQEGSVYYISTPCRVQLAKKQFSNVNNDYELTFERDTVVEKAEEQDGVPQVRFNFTRIGDLQSVEKDTTVDVIGVLQNASDTSQITSKTTSKPYYKRELTLVDDTGYSVRLTIWGNTATTFDVSPEAVLAFKGTKVSDFGGRSLSLLSSGSMTVDPDIDEAHKLKGWYDAQGRTENFVSHQNAAGGTMGLASGRKDQFKTIGAVKDEQLGMSDEAQYFSMKATTMFIRQDNIAYPACLSADCNKKVIEIEPGEWRCERCNISHPKPEYRYMMSINVNDHTGQIWLSCFDETGRALMGMSADELMELKESDEKAAGEVFQEAICKTWNFRCKAKMDTFQEQQRVRYQVMSCTPLDFTVESAKLAELIKQYNID